MSAYSISQQVANVRRMMHDYYIGPLVYEEKDGIRYYRFTVHLRDKNAVQFGELNDLLGATATIAENNGKRVIHISPLHQNASLVRRCVVGFIEQQIGMQGYVDMSREPIQIQSYQTVGVISV